MTTTVDRVIPTGQYLAEVVWTQTEKKSDGPSWVEIVFQITEGPHAGHCIPILLCPTDPQPIARHASRGILAAICRAIDVPPIANYTDDSSYWTLHHRPMIIGVRCHECEVTGQKWNTIGEYKKANNKED